MSFNPDPNAEFGHDPHDVKLHPLRARPASTSRTTRASTGWIAPRVAGSASARRCRRRSETSAFRWCSTRETPTSSGCSRWTAPPSGPARAPTASPPPMSRATPAPRGSGSTRGCRAKQAWWTVKRQAMCCDTRDPVGLYFGTTSRRDLGEPQRGRALGADRHPTAAHLLRDRRRVLGRGSKRAPAAPDDALAATGLLGRTPLNGFETRVAGLRPAPADLASASSGSRRSISNHDLGRLSPSMRVHLSSHFRSYTAERPTVEAEGATVGAVLADLDHRFPGLRFRLIDEQDPA